MSKRTARSRGTSRLLLSEPPDVVAHMVSGLDRLAFLLAGHCGSVHDRPPNRERPAVLLVPDPDDVAFANPGVCVHDARRHHVRPVVDEPHGSHVDRDGPLLRGEGEQPADRRRDAAFEEDRDRVVPPQQQAVRPGFRLVERGVVQRNLHAKLIFEPAEEVRRLLPAEPGAPTDLRGHSDSGTRPGKIILVWASRYLSMQNDRSQPDAAPSDRRTRARDEVGSSRSAWSTIFRARLSCPNEREARAASHHTSGSAGFSPRAASNATMACFGRSRRNRNSPFRRYARSRPSLVARIAASQSARASSARTTASATRPARSRRLESRSNGSAPWAFDAAAAYPSIASSIRSRSSSRTA